MGERVVWAVGHIVLIKIQWTDKISASSTTLGTPRRWVPIWEGNELVTYDMDGFIEQYDFYESNDCMIDND